MDGPFEDVMRLGPGTVEAPIVLSFQLSDELRFTKSKLEDLSLPPALLFTVSTLARTSKRCLPYHPNSHEECSTDRAARTTLYIRLGRHPSLEKHYHH